MIKVTLLFHASILSFHQVLHNYSNSNLELFFATTFPSPSQFLLAFCSMIFYLEKYFDLCYSLQYHILFPICLYQYPRVKLCSITMYWHFYFCYFSFNYLMFFWFLVWIHICHYFNFQYFLIIYLLYHLLLV